MNAVPRKRISFLREKLWLLLSLFLMLVSAAAIAQTGSGASSGQQVIAQVPSPLSLQISPTFDIPLADSSQWFTFGGAIDLGLNYRLPGSIFTLAGGLEYSFVPDLAASSLSFVAAKIGAGVRIPLTSGISIFGHTMAGYYFATYNNLSASVADPYVGAGLGMQFSLSPTFSIGVGAQYKYYLGLYQGISAKAGIDVALGNLGGSVDIQSVELQPAFPVFYKHYDDHPIGTLELKSKLKVPATNIKAQVYVKEYMDAPKRVAVPGTLAPGESRKVDLFALFTDKVLTITEGTKVATEINVSYTVEGQTYEDRRIETMTLQGRNAMTWDDNRKAAAYVTAKEPQVLNFARSVTSYVRAKENRSINDNLKAAIALHEALDMYGLNYTPNPVTPYSEASKQKYAIDFLQFPRETLQYKAGDCSDISILYGALLQAVGIDAAFITIPGHIFVAVNTGLASEKASAALIPENQYIVYKGKAWIPVEITMRHQGFLKAWQTGAKEWYENVLDGQAGFYPIQEAWTAYQPVGLPGTETTIDVPQSDKVLIAYLQEVQKYIDGALLPLVTKLQEQIQSSGSLSVMNSLGVLYAKYGQAEKAEETFREILAQKSYVPALLNLGNLYYLKEDWKDALSYYQQANEIVPNNAHVLLALSRVNRELQDYAEMKRNFDKLTSIDRELADHYSYLGQPQEKESRAASIGNEKIAVIWEDQ